MFYFLKEQEMEDIFLKYINIIKDNKSLWKYSRLKQVIETWQLNTIPDSMFDSVMEIKKKEYYSAN